jgi:hypothetical protein
MHDGVKRVILHRYPYSLIKNGGDNYLSEFFGIQFIATDYVGKKHARKEPDCVYVMVLYPFIYEDNRIFITFICGDYINLLNFNDVCLLTPKEIMESSVTEKIMKNYINCVFNIPLNYNDNDLDNHTLVSVLTGPGPVSPRASPASILDMAPANPYISDVTLTQYNDNMLKIINEINKKLSPNMENIPKSTIKIRDLLDDFIDALIWEEIKIVGSNHYYYYYDDDDKIDYINDKRVHFKWAYKNVLTAHQNRINSLTNNSVGREQETYKTINTLYKRMLGYDVFRISQLLQTPEYQKLSREYEDKHQKDNLLIIIKNILLA